MMASPSVSMCTTAGNVLRSLRNIVIGGLGSHFVWTYRQRKTGTNFGKNKTTNQIVTGIESGVTPLDTSIVSAYSLLSG